MSQPQLKSENKVLSFPKPYLIPNLKAPLSIQFGVDTGSLPSSVLNNPGAESTLSEAIKCANSESMSSRGRDILERNLLALGFSEPATSITEKGVSEQPLFLEQSPA